MLAGIQVTANIAQSTDNRYTDIGSSIEKFKRKTKVQELNKQGYNFSFIQRVLNSLPTLEVSLQRYR